MPPHGPTETPAVDLRHHQVPVTGFDLHVVEAGDPDGRPVLFLHGWPQAWHAWRDVLAWAAPDVRAIAVDLPGVGGSVRIDGGAADGGAAGPGRKIDVADVVHALVTRLRLERPVLVGHDAGGMVAYAYLRRHPGLGAAVIMNTVVPGVEPWTAVAANPYVWHFRFHAVPDLPEMLVRGRERAYFDYFFDVLSPRPEAIGEASRAASVAAYATPGALATGFAWYRALGQDAADNQGGAAGAEGGAGTGTPLLYLRGEHESGDPQEYRAGFVAAGLRDVTAARIPGAGHFAPDESPRECWRLVRSVLERAGRTGGREDGRPA